jgi:hypothetical protein
MMRRNSGCVLFGFSGTQILPLASTASSATMCSAELPAQMPTRLCGAGSSVMKCVASAATWPASSR